jgi:putative addiction module CopG family antidote
MADLIRAKVASGEYATESEVIRDGLRVLIARDRAQEKWLQDEIVSGGEIGDKPMDRKGESKGAAGRRTRVRKAPAAPTTAAAPETERPERILPETPNFEFGRMQVVLKDAPG